MSTSEILNQSRELLFYLGNSISMLISDYQDIIGDSLIIERLDYFKTAYEEAVQRLDNPSLRLATIGTTSSGKSTLVNALTGRKIAPIEAEEMSAGVLLLKHGEITELIVKENPSAIWECGSWRDLRDTETYNRIKGVMQAYHTARNNRKLDNPIEIPEVILSCPILPGCDKSLINLPNDLGIEIIDLPGLKSIQDRGNLKIIQERVSKSFSIVALDYAQIDDEHRKALLIELKEVVEYLRGRTDLMIFLLNRVDLRDEFSLPIEQRTQKMQLEIQSVLNLPELPQVIPFSAQILYYAQCAWGFSSKEHSLVDHEFRRQMLGAMFRDCAKTIKQFTQGDRSLRRWFRDIEDDLDEGMDIDDERARRLLDYALEWSGGKQLWKVLQQRIEKAFPTLIILPAIIDVISSAKGISSALGTIIETRKLQTVQDVDRERDFLLQREKELKKTTDDLLNRFINDIEELVNGLKSSNADDSSKFVDDAKKKGITGLSSLLDLIDDAKKDLMVTIITPTRDMLVENTGAYQLEDILSKSLSRSLANHIARASDRVSRMLGKHESQNGYLTIKIKSDDSKGKNDIERAERAVLTLYQSIREALESRAEFFLQARVQAFESAGNSLISVTREKMIAVAIEKSGTLNTNEIVILELEDYFRNHPLILPEGKIFALPEPIKRKTDSQNKYKTKIIRENKSCFGGVEERTILELDGVETYQVFSIPDYKQMANQWIAGVAQGEEILWNTVKDWLINYMTEINRVLQKSATDITKLALVELDRQRELLESKLESELETIEILEVRRKEIETAVEALRTVVDSQEGKNEC